MMNILLIQSGYIDPLWLLDYFTSYGAKVSIVSVGSFKEAAIQISSGVKPDVILLDGRIPDSLVATNVGEVVFNIPRVPIVNLLTGKTMFSEYKKIPGTYVYDLKTNVRDKSFLRDLEEIIQSAKDESKGKLKGEVESEPESKNEGISES